jgi:hypothetical protein
LELANICCTMISHTVGLVLKISAFGWNRFK